MAHIQLIYGDEPQLIEEEKRKFLSAYPDLPVTVLDDEAGPQKISEKLCEDSLFGDQKVFCLVNLPIIRKSGKIAMFGFHCMSSSWNMMGIILFF